MPRQLQIQMVPSDLADHDRLLKAVAMKLRCKPIDIGNCIIEKQSLDARQKQVKVNLLLSIYNPGEEVPPISDADKFLLQDVHNAPEVHIIGSGPAGIFSALALIELGIKPIIFERGKQVSERKKDVANLNKKGEINPESNWCFGEGGAGTFTDGKLYTRSNKRGNIKKIINTFIEFGANPAIASLAHPHIGTDALASIIKKIRERIIECGGEFHFQSKVTDIKIKNNTLESIEINGSETIPCKTLILAAGHSARDMYFILHKNKIELQAKPFAIGVRIEHPQTLIDTMQYHSPIRDEFLPPAEYSITEQVDGRGVYSFCMCPGGLVVPASTSEGEIVINGMSNSRRNQPLANSGFVVEIRLEDIPNSQNDIFAGMKLQTEIERTAFVAAGSNYQAPAQRLVDFTDGIVSSNLPESSYNPGVVSSDLATLFPAFISERMKSALLILKDKKKEYFTNEALMIAPETRTSSPIFIPRDKENFEHISCNGLFPCGEGAGYSGGIISSAIDGVNTAFFVSQKILNKK